MGKKEKVEALVEGGKASAAPPLGSSLGPLGVNLGQVIAEINKKTEPFKGMKVPVKIIVDTSSKDFTIEIGTPPTSGLIMKELGIEKGSGVPNKMKVGNIAVEQLVKVAQMKRDALYANTLKGAVTNVAGSCSAMGVMIEGKGSEEVTAEIRAGKYDDIILKEKTEVSAEKKALLKAQLADVQAAYSREQEKIKAEQAAAEAAAPAATAAAPAAGAAAPAAAAKTEAAKPAAAKPAEKKK